MTWDDVAQTHANLGMEREGGGGCGELICLVAAAEKQPSVLIWYLRLVAVGWFQLSA
jgi:hypothetical protein